jgi:hypothetical protein
MEEGRRTIQRPQSMKEMNMNTVNPDPSQRQYLAVCCAPISGRRMLFWGSVLLLLGGLGLMSILFPAQQLGRVILPVFLLMWGGALLLGARRTK